MAAIRVSLAFRRASATGVYLSGLRVYAALLGNIHFPSPPFDLAELLSACEELTHAINAAKDRGRAVIETQRVKRAAVVEMLRELAAYVQFAAKNDLSKILSSGFDPASRNTTQSPLPIPEFYSIRNAGAGKLQLKVKPVKNARMYEVWYHMGDRNWRLGQLFRNTRRMILENLTPGTLYTIRIRALGGSTGASDWTDGKTHMST